jgi:hypothetical protein
MTHVWRAHDDVGKEPSQRQRFEIGGATLGGYRRSGNPPATTVEVEDDLARPGPGLYVEGNIGDRGRRGESVE